MARSNAKTRFLEPKSDSAAGTKNVTIRIPLDLIDRFAEANKLANQHGMRLQMSNVVKGAMEDAIDEVNAFAKAQGKLPLGDK